MAGTRKHAPARSAAVEGLFRRVVTILEEARSRATCSVNHEMVLAYWLIGREITERKQGGRARAAYGEAVLEELSRRLTVEFGRGFDVTNLRKMRQFYRMFEIRDAARLESGESKRDAPRLVSVSEEGRLPISGALTWSYYRLLMQVEEAQAREWYMREAADQGWSTRQLERQIFAAKYVKYLPTEAELQNQLRRERRLIDAGRAGDSPR